MITKFKKNKNLIKKKQIYIILFSNKFKLLNTIRSIMNNNSTSIEQMNPVYMAFKKDAGFQWGLFLPALFSVISAMIGIPLNASVCWVTIKHRSSLRYNTCILLALEAFFRILHQMSHFHFFFIALSGINFYPIRLALPIQSYSAIGIFGGISQVALLSLDRLFSVLAPIFYRQISQPIYILCHLFINSSFIAFCFAQLIQSAKNWPEWSCTGLGSDLIALPNVGTFFWSTGLTVNCVSILAYLIVAIVIKLKTEMTTEKQQKIYNSLLLIVLVNVFAYFFYLFVHVLYTLSVLPLTPLQFWHLNMFTCGLFLNIGVIANAPILYYNSMDYRKSYEKEFKKSIRLFKIICRRQEQSTNKFLVWVRFNSPRTIDSNHRSFDLFPIELA